MPVSGIESVPQQLHARIHGCANYELPDTLHCFLGNTLISKCKRGNFHTHRHTWNRDWLDLNVNVDGSARELTKTHKCQTEADRAGAIYFVRRKFCFLWRGGRNFGPGYRAQVMVRCQITRSICTLSICRIGPVIGISLHVGSTLAVSPTYEPQHYKALQSKQKDLCAQRRLRSTRASAQSDQSLRSAHNG